VSYVAGATSATLAPQAPLSPSTEYVIVARGGATEPRLKDVTGNALAQDFVSSFTTVAVDVTPPTVTSTSPMAGATGFVRTANITATFSEPMDAASVTSSTFVLRDASSELIPATVAYNATTRVATLNPAPTLNSGAVYTVAVAGGPGGVRDLAGNAMASDHAWSFTAEVDLNSPSVTRTSPVALATAVSRTANVTVTFSEPMDPNSITATTFELYDSADNPVTATVSYNATSRVATLNPTPTLDYLATYAAIVRGGASGPAVKDVSGNPMAANVVWTFTTVADTTAPTVSSTSPASGATGVSRTANVTATFSEAMDPASIDGASVEIRDASGAAVPATITYSSSTRRVTIDAAATLNGLTTYVVTIRGGSTDPRVKDAQGNPMGADRVWSFVTRQ